MIRRDGLLAVRGVRFSRVKSIDKSVVDDEGRGTYIVVNNLLQKLFSVSGIEDGYAIQRNYTLEIANYSITHPRMIMLSFTVNAIYRAYGA